MARNRIYLDHNASSPLRPQARAAMLEACDAIGNPSSVHAEGRAARRLVEEAREIIAAAVGASPRQVVFTSGGTEANALALLPGGMNKINQTIDKYIISTIEHSSVQCGGGFAASAISHLAVTRDGLVETGSLARRLGQSRPALVSVMLANNETGAIQPISQIAPIVDAAGGLLHSDAIQAFGKIHIDIREMDIDLLTLSAHKVGGPKGIGALVMRDGLDLPARLLRGGGQEFGRRAGTENVPAIAGFGAAVKVAMQSMPSERDRLQQLRIMLETALFETGATIFSGQAPRLPNTTLFSVPGIKAETALIALDLEGIAVSSGSACSSGKVQPSHVLQAMGVEPALSSGAIRLSMGWSTTELEVKTFIAVWKKVSETLPKRSHETELEPFQSS